MKLPIILRIFRNEQLVDVKQFENEQIVIGNKAEVQLDLDDIAVAPIHALIEKRDTGFYICDLGSNTGTFKNSVQILDELIESGDELRIGPFKIVFYVGVPKPKGPPPQSVTQQPMVPKQVDSRYDRPAQNDFTLSEEASKSEVTKIIPITNNSGYSQHREETKSGIHKPNIQGVTITKGPEIVEKSSSTGGHKKKKKTFAPPSYSKDTSEIFRPGKGSIVEVAVAWRERIISTHHFRGRQIVRVGPQGEVDLPIAALGKAFVLGDLNGLMYLNIFPDMVGDLILEHETISLSELESRGRFQHKPGGAVFKLEQGEAIRLSINNGEINFFIRYKTAPPAVAMLPLIPLSASEYTTMIVSLAIVGLLAMWVGINAPIENAEKEKEQEVMRIATFVYNRQEEPPPPPPPPEPPEEKVEPPPPPKVPEKAIVAEKKQEAKVTAKDAGKQNSGGKKTQAPDVRPNPTAVNRPKKFTSSQTGGAVKTATKEGSNANSPKKDLTKVGLFSAFGGGGNRAKLDESSSGAGGVLGLAASATGTSGNAESRAGDDLGSKFKDTGAGGKGVATQGISGGVTKGRSSGEGTYGSDGTGLGQRTGVQVEAGGAEEDFVGTIDREAVRRVVISKRDAIRRCYEKELRAYPDLDGRVLMEWEIIEQGRVKWAKVKSTTLNNKNVETCLKNELVTWRFPEPPKNLTATVTFPFIFKKR